MPRLIQRLSLVLLLLMPALLQAELTTELVRAGKQATALVELRRGANKSFGSAFCIHESGIFVTSAHVAGTNTTLRLVLNPGETTEDFADAKVLRVDTAADLAILRVEHDKPLVALPLGNIDDLIDTMPVTAFGYPFGDALAMQRGDYPSISVNLGRITSLRKKKGELELIQLDAALNPGNSGGPVLDDKGRVVGIVQAGVRGSGVNFAIPVSRLATLVEKPEIVVAPTTMPYDQRSAEQDFSVQVVSLVKPKQPYAVTLSLGAGEPELKNFTAKAGEKDRYTVRAVPVPQRTGPEPLILTAKFSAGSITARVTDAPVTAGPQTLRLADIASIEAGQVTLADGKTLPGPLGGINALPASLGEHTVTLDLGKAQSVRLEKAERPVRAVSYKVVVKSGETVVGEQSGSIELTNLPAAAAAAVASAAAGPVKEAPLEEDLVRRKLPAPIDNVVAGGGGRYLFLHLKKVRKLAVFDVNESKVTQYLPLPSDDVLIAANATKLVIIARDQNVIQRWDLATLRRELTTPLTEQQLDSVAMGHAGSGPLLLMTRNGPRFLDVATLQPSELKVDPNRHDWRPHPQHPYQVRVSADGSTFAGWAVGLSPSGVRTLTIDGNTILPRSEHTTAGILLPSYDGNLLMTGQGIYSAELKPISQEQFRGVVCLPSYNSSYFLGIRTNQEMGRPRENRAAAVSVYTTGDRRQLITLTDLTEIGDINDMQWGRSSGLPIDQRIHFLPDANLLLTISEQRDELVLRRFRITDALDKAGIDYLFVASVAPKTVKRGGRYEYPIVVRSKRGDVKFSLDGAPEGMRITPAGQIEWDAAGENVPARVSVIVSIRDASGQELFHTFTIAVE